MMAIASEKTRKPSSLAQLCSVLPKMRSPVECRENLKILRQITRPWIARCLGCQNTPWTECTNIAKIINDYAITYSIYIQKKSHSVQTHFGVFRAQETCLVAACRSPPLGKLIALQHPLATLERPLHGTGEDKKNWRKDGKGQTAKRGTERVGENIPEINFWLRPWQITSQSYFASATQWPSRLIRSIWFVDDW